MINPAAVGAGRDVNGFTLRPVTPEDAESVAHLYNECTTARRAQDGLSLGGAPQSAAEVEVLSQTGSAFLVAEYAGTVAGAVRYRDEEGIAWFDLLAATVAGAGRVLVRAMEMGAQDRGLRLVRLRVPEGSRLPRVFQRWGYHGVLREVVEVNGEPVNMLVLEKRLPLLTVREQRRSDAAAIGELTGTDPWTFEQGARPGWFVASDGDRVIGVISVRDAGGGTATISVPALLVAYRGRGIEVWMIERCASYAETNGYHTAEMALTEGSDALRRPLEDRFWQREPPLFVKRFRSNVRVDED